METLSERRLWHELRRKRIRGLRFRRQFSLGPYFADFVCLPAKLIVEVDGASHLDAEQMAHDIARTRWLEHAGFKVVRFWNLDVLTNLDRVLEQIDTEVQMRMT